MDLVPTLISTGWASGVNAYGTVALLGLLGRAGVGEVPEPLMRDAVLYGALVMYAIEFVTDKIPYVDNTWDAVHTLIRPAIGSVLGVEFAGLDQVSGFEETLSGGGSGATALVSHGLKAGLRLGINVSPEPVSNIVTSLIEDGLVAAVVALTLKEPLIALALVLVLLATGVGLVVLIRSRIRRALERLRERRRGPPPSGGPTAGSEGDVTGADPGGQSSNRA